MRGRIPDHVVDQIRQQTDIVELIQSYVPLKRAGTNFRALCPFHKEKTPSFNVHPQKQIFHCFGCGIGGDVFRFVMLTESVDFIEAIRFLAKRAGVVLEVETAPAAASTNRKELLYKLHEEVCGIFQKILASDPRGEPGRAYLDRRKVSLESVKEFRLGFAPDAWDSMQKWAAAKRVDFEVLELAGLVTRNEKGNTYDRFRGRLMFPISDEQGRVIAFSGRTLDPDAKEAKYVNSPETPIFTKGKTLYGLEKAKRALLETHKAVVCEGQLDLIACHEAGVSNVVASQGTAFTERHGLILKRYVDEVVLTFDSDAAGQEATVRSVDALLTAGLAVSVATLPKGHDPDSLVRQKGAEAFQQVLGKARSFLEFYLDQLCARHDTKSDAGRAAITQSMAQMLAKVPSGAVSHVYVQLTANRLRLPEEVVRAEIKKALKTQTYRLGVNDASAGVQSYLQGARQISSADRELLHLMLSDPSALAVTKEHLKLDNLRAGPNGALIRKVLTLEQTGQWHGPESLQEELSHAEYGPLLSEMLMVAPPHRIPPADAALACIRSIHQEAINVECQAIQERLADPNLDASEVALLQKRLMELRQKTC